jgi:XTP/dITP diphosphohydrolase
VPRTLIVLSPRLGPVLPASALPALRAADRVYADDTVPPEVAQAAGAEPAPVRVAQAAGTEPAPGTAADRPVEREVLLTLDTAHPLREHADTVIETPEPAGTQLLEAVAVMDRLRSPGGCPWDAEQTHVSLLQYLVEECYELYQAVEDADRPALREELGDVLLQVAFHSRIAQEHDEDPFDIDDVAQGIVTKLIGRHPHVFGDVAADTASDVEANWEQIKAAEKGRSSAVEGVPLAQPALSLAEKLLKRSKNAGVDVTVPQLPESARPAPDISGQQAKAQVGTLLLAVVGLARELGFDPEEALRAEARGLREQILHLEASRTSGESG